VCLGSQSTSHDPRSARPPPACPCQRHSGRVGSERRVCADVPRSAHGRRRAPTLVNATVRPAVRSPARDACGGCDRTIQSGARPPRPRGSPVAITSRGIRPAPGSSRA
jgi:hypothetical protein